MCLILFPFSKRMIKPLIIAFIVVFTVSNVCAQTTHSFGVFPTVNVNGKISEKLDYSLYYFWALNISNNSQGAKSSDGSFAYGEQAVHFHAAKYLTLSGSYVFEIVNPLENYHRNEDRFYVQAKYKYPLGKAQFTQRVRYDGRFIKNTVTGERPYTSRIRYLSGLTVPFSNREQSPYFTTYNEFFFDLYKSRQTIYAENWAFVGIGIHSKKSSAFEMGPLYIMGIKNRNNDISNQWYLQLTWIYQLDIARNKFQKK